MKVSACAVALAQCAAVSILLAAAFAVPAASGLAAATERAATTPSAHSRTVNDSEGPLDDGMRCQQGSARCRAVVPFSYRTLDQTSTFAMTQRTFYFPHRGPEQVVVNQRYRMDGPGTAAAVWDGSFVLAWFLQFVGHADAAQLGAVAGTHPALVDVNGRRVIELGAGLGLCSIVAGALGAAHVEATDGDAVVLPLLSENLATNINGGSWNASVLQWGREAAKEFAALREPFDIILGADVVFERAAGDGGTGRSGSLHEAGSALEDLVSTIHELAKHGTDVLIAYVPRYGRERRFFHAMEAAGFTSSQVPRRWIHSDFRSTRLRILHFRLHEEELETVGGGPSSAINPSPSSSGSI